MKFDVRGRQTIGLLLLALLIAIFIIVRSWRAMHWNLR